MKVILTLIYCFFSFAIYSSEIEKWIFFLERDILFHDAFYISEYGEEYTLSGSADILTDINQISEEYRTFTEETTILLNDFVNNNKDNLIDYDLYSSMIGYNNGFEDVLKDEILNKVDGAFRLEGGLSYFETFYLEREVFTDSGYQLTLGRFYNNSHGIYHWGLINPGAVENLDYFINSSTKTMNFNIWYAETNIKIMITIQYDMDSTLTLFIYKLEQFQNLLNDKNQD